MATTNGSAKKKTRKKSSKGSPSTRSNSSKRKPTCNVFLLPLPLQKKYPRRPAAKDTADERGIRAPRHLSQRSPRPAARQRRQKHHGTKHSSRPGRPPQPPAGLLTQTAPGTHAHPAISLRGGGLCVCFNHQGIKVSSFTFFFN